MLAKLLYLGLLAASSCGSCEESCEPQAGQAPSLWPRPELNKPLYIPSPWGIPSSRDYYTPKLENLPFMRKPKETMIAQR